MPSYARYTPLIIEFYIIYISKQKQLFMILYDVLKPMIFLYSSKLNLIKALIFIMLPGVSRRNIQTCVILITCIKLMNLYICSSHYMSCISSDGHSREIVFFYCFRNWSWRAFMYCSPSTKCH